MKKNLLYLFGMLSIIACQKVKEVERPFDLYEVKTFTVVAGDNEATASWTLQDGKPNPNEFLLIWTPDLTEVDGGKATVAGNETSYCIPNLVNGYAYKVTLQARYENGLSQMASGKVTPKTNRYPVTNFAANAGSERVLVKWTKPETDRVQSYTLTWIPGDGKAVINDVSSEKYLVSNLKNDVEYSFSLICNYPNGDSESSVATAVPGVVYPILTSKESAVRFEQVDFEYNPMYFMAGTPESVEWVFVDGETITGTMVSYKYKTAGTKTVKCKVTYTDKTSETAQSEFSVGDYAWSNVALVAGDYKGYVKTSNPVFSPDGSTVYVTTSNGKGDMFAVDAYTGVIKWTYPIAKATYGGGPAVGKDGTIYVGAQGTTQYAVKPDGETKWSFETCGNVEAFPAITSNNLVYFAANGTVATLYQVNGNTGENNWSKELAGGTSSAVAVDADGNVYVATNSGIWSFTESGTERWHLADINITERGAFAINGTTLYAALKGVKSVVNGGLIAIDMTAGTEKWRYVVEAVSDSYFPIVGPDGTIYFTSKGTKKVYAINADGSKKWESGAIAAFIYNGVVVDVDNNIYAGTQAVPTGASSRQLVKFNGQTGSYTMSDDDQIMSAFTIGPDNRVYYGTVGANMKTVETNGPASSWCMRGGNCQGTNSLK